MKKVIIVLLVIVIIAVVVAGGVLLKKRRQIVASAPTAAPVSYTVKTVLPQQQAVSQTRSFLAQLETVSNATISSKLSGQIRQVLVQENQQVQPGDLLIRIDDKETQTAISALQAKLSAAVNQREYSLGVLQRNRALFDVGGLSKEKLEGSELAYNSAAASVKELQQNIKGLKNQLGYFNIRASAAGVVGTVLLHRGDLATPGRPILTINSLLQKLTFSFAPEATNLIPGQEVLLKGGHIGTIIKIYDDAKNGLSVAEVRLEKRIDRPSGSYLSVDVVTVAESGCGVPLQALLHRKSGISLMVYQDGHFVETSVNVTVQGADAALIEPCVTARVAVASEAKLSLLPGYGNITVLTGE